MAILSRPVAHDESCDGAARDKTSWGRRAGSSHSASRWPGMAWWSKSFPAHAASRSSPPRNGAARGHALPGSVASRLL